jgi:hypothetical protein
MEKGEYIKRSNWYGSFYELAMEYYPRGGDARLLAALHALWSDSSLFGPLESPYYYAEVEATLLSPPLPPESAQRAVPSVPIPDALDPVGPNNLYGLLMIPGRPQIAIICGMVREEYGSDWLDFCIPMGMLDLIMNINYPLSYSTSSWMEEVNGALARLADTIYAVAPFDLAYIGEDVSGLWRAGEIKGATLEAGGVFAPPSLVRRLQPQAPSLILPSGAHWFTPRADAIGG